ncbi:MAG: hypothetical protein Q9162_005314 [Coniocarpon cinnabarinum]
MAANKMPEAHVSNDTTVTVEQVPIPEPTEPHSIVVRVHVCGINPKDWKMPAGILTSISDCPNSGDDIAGIVHSVHPTVKNFKPGNRVAARMALFAQLRAAPGPFLPLPDPQPSSEHVSDDSASPALIYGASTNVGMAAVRLAQASNIHPLICVAGSGTAKVQPLLNAEKGDVVLDHRVGRDELVKQIRAAVPSNAKLTKAFDVVSEGESWMTCASALDKPSHLLITLPPAKKEIPTSIRQTAVMAGSLWQELKSTSGQDIGDLGFKDAEGKRWGSVFARDVEGLLERGALGAPEVEVVEGGLGRGVESALRRLRWGKEGKRFAVRVVEEYEGV